MHKIDADTAEQMWQDPDWVCPQCEAVNMGVRERCRICGFDSALVSGECYFPISREEQRNG